MAGFTDTIENSLTDFLWRGQTFTALTTLYFALFTAAPGETGGGTEASYTGYARVGVAASLANFAGTQGAGTTVASSGTGGQTSNNAAITFGAPTSGPQTVVASAIMSASSAGTMHVYATLTSSRTLNNGDAAPSFAAGAHTMTLD